VAIVVVSPGTVDIAVAAGAAARAAGLPGPSGGRAAQPGPKGPVGAGGGACGAGVVVGALLAEATSSAGPSEPQPANGNASTVAAANRARRVGVRVTGRGSFVGCPAIIPGAAHHSR
jgi:hypothetical protein